MYTRLAFAVAIHVDAEVLIIDEALAVGDEAFQRKCFAKLQAFKEQGKSLLFVSHNTQAVLELCDRAVLLDAGELLLDADPKTVISQYQRLVYAPADKLPAIRRGLVEGREEEAGSYEDDVALGGEVYAKNRDKAYGYHDPNVVSTSVVSYAAHGAEIQNIVLLDPEGNPVNMIRHGEKYFYRYEVVFYTNAEKVRFGCLVKTIYGVELGGMISTPGTESADTMKTGSVVEVHFPFRCLLAPGAYFFNSGVTGTVGGQEAFLHRVVDAYMFKVLPKEGLKVTQYVDFSGGESAIVSPRNV
jgi:lipopolysaccharide transport system ATP-binding protein